MGFQGSRQIIRKDGHLATCFLLPLVTKNPKTEILIQDMAELLAGEEVDIFKNHFQVSKFHVFFIQHSHDLFTTISR